MRSHLAYKDPGAKLDFGFQWSIWPDNDEIEESVWIVPDGLAQHDTSLSDRLAKIWLSGGVLGSVYPVINRVTTAGGRHEDKTIHLRIRERVFQVTKDPNDVTDYVVDWKRWIGVDVITASSWTMPVGITLSDSAFASSSATGWISGGQDDQIYTVKNQITTAAGRIDIATLRIAMRHH